MHIYTTTFETSLKLIGTAVRKIHLFLKIDFQETKIDNRMEG